MNLLNCKAFSLCYPTGFLKPATFHISKIFRRSKQTDVHMSFSANPFALQYSESGGRVDV